MPRINSDASIVIPVSNMIGFKTLGTAKYHFAVIENLLLACWNVMFSCGINLYPVCRGCVICSALSCCCL